VSARPGRAAASALGVLALALGVGLGGCGGSAKVSDVVPKSTPELTPPEGHTDEYAGAKKTHVTTVASSSASNGESSHQESTEGTGSSPEDSGKSSESSSSGESATGAGGGTSAGEHGSESSGSGASAEAEHGGASAP